MSNNDQKAKTEKSKRTLNRRELLKLGAMAGSAAIVTSKGFHASGQRLRINYGGGGSGSFPLCNDRCYSNCPTISPPVTPFMAALPIPPVAQPSQLTPAPTLAANTAGGEAPRANHQRWTEFLPAVYYDFHAQEFNHSFHPQYPSQPVWGYNGRAPGPVIKARYGTPILVRVHNDLPANHIGFGDPRIVTHLHGGHTASESDGFAGEFYASGLFKDHHYPNILAGYDTFGVDPITGLRGDTRETEGFLFYHDHRVDFTAANNYKGLQGFYLMFDPLDSDNENDPNPAAFRLPSGQYDIPMIFNDKSFGSNKILAFDDFNLDGFIGDQFLVNGAIQPYLQVARRKYRFRLVNGGPSRFYQFFMSSGQNFTRISSDGNLLPAPITQQSVTLGVAERVDVIVDFAQYNIGTQVYLQNRMEQCNGRGPTGNTISPGVNVLRFDVTSNAADPSRVPATLRPLPSVDTSQAVTTRYWKFDNRNGQWTVNDRVFDINRVDATVRKGTAEIWDLKNEGRDWSHPIHIHLESFQVISVNGSYWNYGGVPPDNSGRKDVITLGPRDEVQVFIRFREWTGKYVMHCHNQIHEDHAMMIRYDVVP
jgi:FtsP/CotA-like multicopper oxidase with cupredoxin domain